MKRKTKRAIGIIAMIAGSLLFFLIGILSIWGEIEASFFNAALRQMEPLSTLKCPIVITPNEEAFVSASFSNPTEKRLDLVVRTYVTSGYVTLMNEYISEVSLLPDETKVLKVPIRPEDAAYNRLVLVRMHQLKHVPLPYRNASCGVVLVKVPFLSGNQFVFSMITLGMLLSTGGIGLWTKNAKPILMHRRRIFWAMVIFSATSFTITLAALLNWWRFGIILTVVWLLMGVGMLYQFLTALESNHPYASY